MKKKKNTVFKTEDKIVILICALGIGVSLFNYFADVYRVNRRSDTQPIARITSKVKSVQRRFRDRLVWDMLRNDSPLYSGDFVRTASFSEAVITFDSGAVLNMAQDSLVEILPESDTMNLKIAAGTISIKTPKKVTLTAGSEVLELTEDSVITMNVVPVEVPSVVALDEDSRQNDDTNNKVRTPGTRPGKPQKYLQQQSAVNRINVTVQSGSVTQNKTDGTVVHVKAGSKLVLDSNDAQSGTPSLIVTSPSAVQKVIKGQNESAVVTFTWSEHAYTKGTKTRIELAYDNKFAYPYQTADYENTTSGTFTLPNRAVYWRAYPVNDAIDIPSAQTAAVNGIITVHGAVPIKKTLPLNGGTVASKNGKNSVRFSWTQDPLAHSYVLTAGLTPNSASPELSFTTEETSITLNDFASGTWYWNITPVYPEGTSFTREESTPFTFIVPEKESLRAVQTFKPAKDEVIYTANGRQPILFNWQHAPQSKEYTLLISDNRELKNPIVTRKTEEPYVSLVPKDAGLTQNTAWYWGVYFTDSDGTSSPVSLVHTFNTIDEPPYLTAASPADNAVLEKSAVTQTVFSVNTNIPKEKRFQIALDRDFKSCIVDVTLNSSSFMLTSALSSGFYYWKISCDTFTTPVHTLCVKEAKSGDEADFVEVPLVKIQGGKFTMGRSDGTAYEKPVRTVSVNGFYMGTGEVTQAQFELVMGTNPSQTVDPLLPVSRVTWFEAIEFCNKLSMINGFTPYYTINQNEVTVNEKANGYRLPSEAEWEHAAKTCTAPDTPLWTKETSGGTAHRAAESEESAAVTVQNMLGNMNEWCFDWYAYYRATDTVNPKGAATGTMKALRGGSWADGMQRCTETFRVGQRPLDRANTTGFRVCRNAN